MQLYCLGVMRLRTISGLFAAVLSCLAASTVVAQDFSIDWYSIDGGGATSVGGDFSLSGTIAQTDTATMSGGNFTLEGGFWSLFAAVQPSAGRLYLFLSDSNTLYLTWPIAFSNAVLEETPDIGSAQIRWQEVATQPTTVGEEVQVILPVPSGNRFYRLRVP